VAPGALRFGVLFCGLPAPSGDGQLRIVPGADAGEVMRGLDEVMDGLARREGAGMVVIKELREAAAREIGGAESLGYVRGEVPAVYVLRRRFSCFEEYCARLRTDYRRKVELSVRKLRESDCRVEYLYGEEIAGGYTDACHRLYEAVWERATYRLERWPAGFFRAVARAFGREASMTRIVGSDGRVVAWAFGLTCGGVYHNLYGGLDYALNDRHDLYFNAYYRDMDRAFR
jgi:predicted N-acyltransferase